MGGFPYKPSIFGVPPFMETPIWQSKIEFWDICGNPRLDDIFWDRNDIPIHGNPMKYHSFFESPWNIIQSGIIISLCHSRIIPDIIMTVYHYIIISQYDGCSSDWMISHWTGRSSWGPWFHGMNGFWRGLCSHGPKIKWWDMMGLHSLNDVVFAAMRLEDYRYTCCNIRLSNRIFWVLRYWMREYFWQSKF